MMASKARIEKVAFIGWLGIEYEEIDLDPALTGLTGNSGAGKSTLVMCLDYALLPDRIALTVHPISEVVDLHAAGVDPIGSRISSQFGYAYVVLDVLSRQGGRLIAGIHVRNVDGRAEFTRWSVGNAPQDKPLQDIMRAIEGEEEYYPDIADLRRNLAARGIDLCRHDTVGDYGQVLYEAGILPAPLYHRNDRTLYGKLVETAFRGGISAEVAKNLKQYLLPPAGRIPDAVSKLQEYTDQVLRTRSALSESKRQLALLEATYGNGKELLTRALGALSRKRDSAIETHRSKSVELETKKATKTSLEEQQGRIKSEIDQAKLTLDSVVGAKKLELKVAMERADQAQLDENLATTKRAEANDAWNGFKKGRSHWDDCRAGSSADSPESLDEWFRAAISSCDERIGVANHEIEKLRTDKLKLSSPNVNQKVTNIAQALGADTLADRLDDLDAEQARALDMTLGGMTDGVVGADLEDLVKISPSDEFPALFWMGQTSPRAVEPHSVANGKWFVTPLSGGYVVASETYESLLGSKSRLVRSQQIEQAIEALEQQKTSILDAEKTPLVGRQTRFQRNRIQIDFYYKHRERGSELEHAASEADSAFAVAKKNCEEAKQKRDDLTEEINNASEPYTNQINSLNSLHSENAGQLRKLAGEIDDLSELLPTLSEQAEALIGQSLESESILASAYAQFIDVALREPPLELVQHIANQTKAISALSQALEDESSQRLSPLIAANAGDELSCIRVWPMLMEILKDRIPEDFLDADGQDLLSQMQDRRSGLEVKLQGYETDVRNQARFVHKAIDAEISTQISRVRALSRFGQSLCFGNVVGVRLAAESRSELLETLRLFADQMSLFGADDQRPLEQTMASFFEKTMGLKLKGEELLDYRTFMDLTIYVKRKNSSDWTTASSLSGGESIGCGLAVALMLFRSIADRGEIRSADITPLFAIDEVQRLDGDGQKVIADFCEREGFQVIVTAPELRQKYRCKFYALARTYDPVERLIIRELRGFHRGKDVPDQ